MEAVTCTCGRELAPEAGRFCPGCGVELAPLTADTAALPRVEREIPIVVQGAVKRKLVVGELPPAVPPVNGHAPAVAPPPPREPALMRYRWPILGGALVTLALLAGVLALRLGSGDDARAATDAAAPLADARRELEATFARLAGAELVADLRKAGAAAAAPAGRLEQPERTLGAIEDDRIGPAALKLVRAERKWLAAVAQLESLKPSSLEDWDGMKSAIAAGQAEVIDASRAVTALQLRGTEPVVPAESALEQSIADVDEVVTGAERKLERWRRDLRRARRINAQKPTVTASPYRTSMEGVLEDYYNDREATRAFYQRADSYSPQAARAAIAGFQGQRQSTISSMSALAPPPAAVAQHQELISVVQESLGALGLAMDAVDEYEIGPYSYLTDTPSWGAFDAQSSGITARFEAVKRAWSTVAGSGTTTTPKRVSVPRKPKV